MSYCRNNGVDSDVYLIRNFPGFDKEDPTTHSGTLECMACLLSPDRTSFVTQWEWCMLLHLDEHANAGHKVPNRARKRLKEEMDA